MKLLKFETKQVESFLSEGSQFLIQQTLIQINASKNQGIQLLFLPSDNRTSPSESAAKCS